MVVAERDLQSRNYYGQQHEIYRHERKRYQPKRRPNQKVSYIVKLAIIALLAFLLLSRFSFIVEGQYRLERLQSEINNIESQNERLRVEIANLKSVARIEDIAKNKLNMKEPENHQIIYFSGN